MQPLVEGVIVAGEVALVFAAATFSAYYVRKFRLKKILRGEEQPITPRKFVSASQKRLYDNFLKYVKDEQAYLNPDLTLNDVCRALGSNRTYVSVMISHSLKMSFKQVLAKLRIEHAKRLLKADKSLTMDDIAEQSGFITASQFVRKFKSLTGITPGAWRDKQ